MATPREPLKSTNGRHPLVKVSTPTKDKGAENIRTVEYIQDVVEQYSSSQCSDFSQDYKFRIPINASMVQAIEEISAEGPSECVLIKTNIKNLVIENAEMVISKEQHYHPTHMKKISKNCYVHEYHKRK